MSGKKEDVKETRVKREIHIQGAYKFYIQGVYKLSEDFFAKPYLHKY